ncbi:DNA polymerase III subunit alpha [Geodia barretti]|uniref:DNA-directed DNA polymerase n=1 Tax=Geodia barretti TaxID=519541 RepID=A0AA35SAI2_GEOBA|nr:DNA polymerase III subunit alpha [Geodia barretti]
MLAKDTTGYRNLTKLVSKGYLEGYYYNPRIDKELLREHAEGLICMSACIGGEIPHLIQREGLAAAETVAREFMDIFGDDYYLEIQRHDIDPEAKVNDGLLKLHHKLGVPLVATNDFHFLRATDHDAHDALICIQTGKTVDEKNRLCYPAGLYMKSPEEMQTLFADLPDALERTLEIADKCNVELEFGKTYMPNFPIPAGYASSDDYLTQLAQEGLERRYGTVDPAVQERLDYELSVITSQDFSGYFLIVWDLINYARQQDISRFLNPERIEPPDIDIDFDDTRRDEVLRYVVDKYGKDNVSQVITFGTMGAKAVVRDVGRVLGMSLGEVDRIAKLVPTELKITLDKAIERVPELQQIAQAPGNEGKLVEYARKLEGTARHASVHACAVIIAPGELTDYVPLYRSPKDGRITTQFVGETCMDIGLLKMDILGLKELSLVDEAVRLIQLKEPDFDLETLPWDDRATFDLFGRGETIGVFQFESAGMREYLIKLKPDTIEDIIAMNALYRPGPMDNIPTFIARKRGEEPVSYDHPKLESILEPTYGIMVYQEQVMRIAQELAGFTLGQADILRKAMGKKKPEEMAKVKKDFVGGCVAHEVEKTLANKLFGEIEIFAGYAFNKSHAVCYAEGAYKNAYLKANYPQEYMAASLTIERGNTDRLTILLDDCRRMGIRVMPPDINQSTLNFTPTDEGIRYGLAAIKNVGEGAAQSMVDTRIADGPFTTLFEFCERIDLRAVNRRVVESLIAAGALDGLEGHRAQRWKPSNRRSRPQARPRKPARRGRSASSTAAARPNWWRRTCPMSRSGPSARSWPKERDLLGFYISSHPLKPYARDLKNFARPLSEIDGQHNGAPLRVGGLVEEVRKLFDRRGNPFAFVTLKDLNDTGDIAFFAEAFANHQQLLVEGETILVEGRVYERNGRLSVQADRALPLKSARAELTKSVTLSLPYQKVGDPLLSRLRHLCERHMGDCELWLQLKNGDEQDKMVRSKTIRVDPCDDLLRGIEELIGPRSTRLEPKMQAPVGFRHSS